MSFSTLLHTTAALSCSTLRAEQQKPCWNESEKKPMESQREKGNLRMHRVQCWHLRPHRRRLCDFSVFHLRWAKSGTTNFHALCCFMNPLKWVVYKCLVSGDRGSLTSNFYSKCSGLNSPLYRGSSGFSAGFAWCFTGKKNTCFLVIVLLPGVKMTRAVQVFVKDIMLPKGSKMEWNLTRLVPLRAAPAQNSGPNTTQECEPVLEKRHMHIFMKCI